MMLSEDHRAVQDAVRAYVQDHIAPNAARWDKEHHFPAAELKGLAQLGCFGVAVPAEYDGAGLDYLALAVILEEVAAGDGGTSTAVSVNNCPVSSILMTFANEEQKQRWLRPLARGEILGAFCLTEPHVGSEASGLKTTATKDGGDYVLNGVKQFITSGKYGDVAIVMAVTDKAAGKKGISAFVVPTKTPGYTVARIEDKLGQHSSDTAQIVFENCRVPAANRLADEGMGLKIALSGLEGGRIGIAAQSVGMARAAFDAAPGGAVSARRDGDADRSGAPARAPRREPERRRRAVPERGRDGQAVRQRNGRACLLGRDPDLRRLRLRERLSGRAHLPRRARVPDLRRHQRRAEDPDRPGARVARAAHGCGVGPGFA
jgi:alkylation response protein AidB-like acyl-CoA dehydrogenase